MCNFRVGQKVVCVDSHKASWVEKKIFGLFRYRAWVQELVEGEVYTVTSIMAGTDIHTKSKAVGITVAEISGGNGSAFRSSRFRPLIEKKTDIEIFRRMLNTTPETVGAA